jgi:hypothetical protein
MYMYLLSQSLQICIFSAIFVQIDIIYYRKKAYILIYSEKVLYKVWENHAANFRQLLWLDFKFSKNSLEFYENPHLTDTTSGKWIGVVPLKWLFDSC